MVVGKVTGCRQAGVGTSPAPPLCFQSFAFSFSLQPAAFSFCVMCCCTAHVHVRGNEFKICLPLITTTVTPTPLPRTHSYPLHSRLPYHASSMLSRCCHALFFSASRQRQQVVGHTQNYNFAGRGKRKGRKGEALGRGRGGAMGKGAGGGGRQLPHVVPGSSSKCKEPPYCHRKACVKNMHGSW